MIPVQSADGTAISGSLEAIREATRQVLTALGMDPLLVVSLLFGSLAIGGYLGIRILTAYRKPGRRFMRLLRDVETVTILMHENPDPDAMGTALGVAELAERADTTPHIQYGGEIRHHENRAFQAVLDLDFERIEQASDLRSEYVILVDHNEPRGFDGAAGVTPIAVIDHHPGDGEGTVVTDVRPEYGACASIVSEYLREAGAEPKPPEQANMDENAIPTSVATGLLYGIQTDTRQLTNGATPAEFAAAEFLYPGIDGDLLTRIANPQVDAEILEVKAKAITNRDVRMPYCVSNVGEISNADAVPIAADELADLEGITAVVVIGKKDGTIHLSGRARDDRVHMGNVLATVAEEIPNSGAGGHARMGGGQIDHEQFDGELREQLFKAMGGE